MTVVLHVAVLIGSFILMEGVAWLTHRYIMHGPFWMLHEDHHDPKHEHTFQKNDLFFLFFALPGILLVYFGLQSEAHPWLAWSGWGVALYGLAYFLVHEGVIHRRIRIIPTMRHPYFVALRKAHGAHHRKTVKEGGECFGMLLVPWRFYRDEWAKTRK